MDNAPAAVPFAARPVAAPGKLPVLPRPDARIGLYGGTFDPPHLGHLALALAALAALKLDQLFFIPAAQAPLRSAPAVASVADRLEMLRRAVAEAADPRLAVLDIEARADGVNYTVDTLRQLRAAWPGAQFYFLLGADQFSRLPLWREPEALAQLVEFAVFDRPGADAALPSPPLVSQLRWQRIASAPHPASSSEIRRRLHARQNADDWLPRSVAAYIEEKKLYR